MKDGHISTENLLKNSAVSTNITYNSRFFAEELKTLISLTFRTSGG